MPEITLEAIGQMMDEKLDKRLAESEQRSTNNMMVLIESRITPQLKLLAEGQQELRELMTPKSEIEDLKDEMAVLKMAIRKLTEDMQELKKAQ